MNYPPIGRISHFQQKIIQFLLDYWSEKKSDVVQSTHVYTVEREYAMYVNIESKKDSSLRVLFGTPSRIPAVLYEPAAETRLVLEVGGMISQVGGKRGVSGRSLLTPSYLQD